MDNFWDNIIWQNSIRNWAICVGIVAGTIVFLRLVQKLAIRRLLKLTQSTKSTLDDFVVTVIQNLAMPIGYVLAVYIGVQYLTIPDRINGYFRTGMMIVVTFFVVKIILRLIGYVFREGMSKHTENVERQKQAKGIMLIIQFVVSSVAFLFLIDNLGYDITTLVAGLGIGGIAIALAAQTILGDLFSYLVIFFDKPFEIGDFIIVDEKLGTVEYIGIKTTQLRTLNGEQLIFSNTDLTNSRLHNYKRMKERRIVFKFGLTYDSTKEQLKALPEKIRNIVNSIDNARFDRAHFSGFGSSSLDFEVVYYVLTPDYTDYMNIQQQINLQLIECLETEKLQFAFPTQTIILQGNQMQQKSGPVSVDSK